MNYRFVIYALKKVNNFLVPGAIIWLSTTKTSQKFVKFWHFPPKIGEIQNLSKFINE